ncbi:MAG: GNAT family N-acetyltransferase [Oscillospiraceae bacterium]
MIDKDIPYLKVYMTKPEITEYPKYSLPDGFYFKFYDENMDSDWVRLQMYEDVFENFGEAIRYFNAIYVSQGNVLKKRMAFICDDKDMVVGCGALWFGNKFGVLANEITSLIVHPNYRGLGLAKALVSRLLDLHKELECKGGIYSSLSSWDYKAIDILFTMGFVAYMGKPPVDFKNPATFKLDNQTAWKYIMTKLTASKSEILKEQIEKYGLL